MRRDRSERIGFGSSRAADRVAARAAIRRSCISSLLLQLQA